MTVEELIVVSNVALVLVTAVAAWVGFREGHRHEEHATDEMASIVHEVLEAEHARAEALADRHAQGHDGAAVLA
ncbi:membrane protein [Arthrobacter phage Berrie]|uniref:Membrane protein n=1 Tax=Arthrobacter phage Berrie TaxID=2926087 RepID=A0ABZ2CM00_9CAUD